MGAEARAAVVRRASVKKLDFGHSFTRIRLSFGVFRLFSQSMSG